MEEVREVKKKSKEKESRFGKRYGFELKLRCVKLRLEEGLPVSLLRKEVGVSKDVVYGWVKAYQEQGEAGLRNKVRSSERRRKLPGPVRKKINHPQSLHGQDREEDRALGRLSEALGDLDSHTSQDIRITSQLIVIPTINHGLGDGISNKLEPQSLG